jgi:hypothetical protein
MGYGGTYKLKGRKYTAKFKTNKTGEITGFKQIVPEHELQAELMRWAKRYEDNYPELWLLHAIPNGGKRNVKDAVKLKREGVKAGVPDLFMPGSKNGISRFIHRNEEHRRQVDRKTAGMARKIEETELCGINMSQ